MGGLFQWAHFLQRASLLKKSGAGNINFLKDKNLIQRQNLFKRASLLRLKNGGGKRVENEQAWKVPVEKIAENGWNLDIKNPFVKEEEVTHTTAELLDMLSSSFKKSDELINELKKELK